MSDAHSDLIGGLLGVRGWLPQEQLEGALAAAPYRGPVTDKSVYAAGALWAMGACTLTRTNGLVVGLHGRLDNTTALAAQLGCRPEAGYVVAKAYQRWGPDCVDRLLGDFAALLLNAESGELTGLRDWMGTHPLFHTRAGTTVVMASEVSQLLLAHGTKPNPDPVTAAAFQTTQGLSVERTFYEGVWAVAPNGWARGADGRVDVGEVSVAVPRLNVAQPEAVRETRRLLDTAVARRLPVGRPTASCVSGGMDSTTVAAAAHRVLTTRGEALTAGYCFAFPEVPECDEMQYARAVCTRLGVPLRPVVIRPADLKSRWSQAAAEHAGPVFATGVFVLDLITQASADGMQVLLTGHGGDQWFGPQVEYLSESLLHRDPSLAWAIAQETRRRGQSLRPYAADLRLAAWRGLRGGRGRVMPGRGTGWGRLAAETEERAGAQRGVLVTAPLFDRDLATFTAGLAPRLHATLHVPKLLLRQAMSQSLPTDVLSREGKTEFSPVLRRGLGYGSDDRPLQRAHQEAIDQWLKMAT